MGRVKNTFATALFHGMNVADIEDLDLSYTHHWAAPYDALQIATHQWVRDHEHSAARQPS